MRSSKIRAIFFDFMEWRHDYFDCNAARLASGQTPEDIDITLRNVLDDLIDKKHPEYKDLFDEKTRERCVQGWHSMVAWPDVRLAVKQLKAAGYEVFVHANGTTRLQLDLCRSAGFEDVSSFNMLFSSELLGVYKPAPESYEKVLRLVKRGSEECVMVAAHAYDTRGAKEVGMRTVYVHRWTDDIYEDMDVVRSENDVFLEDMTELLGAIGRL